MTSPRRRLLADPRPLRASPAYRRVWLGSGLSAIGGTMTSFALALQIYTITRSSAAVGALGLALAVPLLAVGLFGGSFADAVDRRLLVLTTSSLLAVTSALLAAQAFAGLDQLWLLYALAAVQSLIGALDQPARRTFLARLLPMDLVPAGAALNMLSFQVALLVGPAVAGVLTAAGGLRLCYLVDAVSFAAAVYGVVRMPALPPQEALRRPGLRATLDGFAYLRRTPVLIGVFLADLDAMVLGMPVALFPAINAEHFGGSPESLGLLTAALGVGGLVGSGLSGRLGHVARPGRKILVSVAVWGAAVAAFGVARPLWVALAAIVVAGIADSVSVILRAALVQTSTPDALRGRVSAVDYVVGAGGPQLGNLRAGVVGSLTTPATSAVAGGLAVVVVAGALRVCLPAMARWTREPTAG